MNRSLRLALFCALVLMAAPCVRGGSPPVRLASLSPNLTEITFALGLDSNLIARSSACDYPPEVRSRPVIGGFGRPSLEAVLKARPEVLLVTDLEQPSILAPLREAGIRIESIPCESWDGIARAAERIAALCGDPITGRVWASAFRARVQSLETRTKRTSHPSVWVELWADPLTTAARDSFLSQVIQSAGGRNIGDRLEGRYATVQSEWVLQSKPDVLLLAYMPPSATPSVEQISKRAGWSALESVQTSRVIRGIDPDLLLRPGPRLIEGCEQLARELERLDLP